MIHKFHHIPSKPDVLPSFVLRATCDPYLEVIVLVLHIELIFITILGHILVLDELFQFVKAFLLDHAREAMSGIVSYHLCVRLRREQSVRDELLFERVFSTVQVDRREAKLGYHPLGVQLVLVPEAHVKDGTCDVNDELRHLKDLLGMIVRSLEGLGLDLLRDSVEMAKNDAALGKRKNAIERALRLHYIQEVVDDFLQAIDNVW